MDPEHNEEPHREIKEGGKAEMAHDSMVTVRLSESPLTINTTAGEEAIEEAGEEEASPDSAEVTDANESPTIVMLDPNGNETSSPSVSESTGSPRDTQSRRDSDSSESSECINWEELEKTEEKEPRDQVSDDVRPLPSEM
jgi:hypothetical protein